MVPIPPGNIALGKVQKKNNCRLSSAAIGQKTLTLSRILTKCFKWSENGQKIRTKSENVAKDSEEETILIMLILCNTLLDTFIITSKSF